MATIHCIKHTDTWDDEALEMGALNQDDRDEEIIEITSRELENILHSEPSEYPVTRDSDAPLWFSESEQDPFTGNIIETSYYFARGKAAKTARRAYHLLRG